MNLDQALHTFIEESRELLSSMEDSLLRVPHEEQPQQCIHAIFRAAHTIKGSAGLFGLEPIVAFTHVAESLLDEVREGQVALTASLIQVLLQCCDHMHALTTAVENQTSLDNPVLQANSTALMAALQSYSNAAQPVATEALPAESLTAAGASPATADWHIAVRFGPTVLQNGMDPLSFLRYLHTLGEVLHTEVLINDVPALEALDAEQCYLGMVLHFRTACSQAEIIAVFEFVQDDCELCVTPLFDLSACESSVLCGQSLQCTAGSDCALGCASTDLLQHIAATEILEAEALPEAPAQPPSPALCPVQGNGTTPPVTAQQQVLHAGVSKPRTGEMQSVRVDAQKLDQLINLVGELITASAGVTEVARRLRQSEMLEANATLTALVEQVRDQALQLRMVKIGGTFNKFQRVVHDVSRELGKDIALTVSGEDTELDKTVVERIGDPLTHLVRNAMDHGIEPAAVRLQRGKPAQGHVHLNAFHESGYIVIEIKDDGGGLDTERILAKGVERGLVEPGRNLSEKEIHHLIFEPGFSTAERVTNLSGRGVGMDVVRSNITALRGTVELSSQLGIGTTLQVRLPLTLAIINGFQVRVGKSVLVIPLEVIDECVEFTGRLSHDYTDLRGHVLPFVNLREHFAIQGPRSARPNIVVIKHGSQRFGLLVDELLGEAQTVIKPLSRLFSRVPGISGSSILGNGNVALILDIPVLHTQLLSMAQSPARNPNVTVQ